MIDYRAIAEAETPAIRLRILRLLDQWPEPLSAKLVARELKADITSVAYHCRKLQALGLTEVAHEQEKPYRELYYRLSEGAKV